MPYCLHLPWIDSFHYASQTAPEARAFIGQNLVKGDNPEVNRNFHFPLVSFQDRAGYQKCYSPLDILC